jgi:MFS family permease
MKSISSKWAIAALFLLDGAGFGTWAAHIPVIQRNLHLDTAALSFVLLSVVIGSIVSMPLTGYLIAHFGSRAVVRTAAGSYIASLALLAHLDVYRALMIGAALFGAAKGSLDVSVNAQALAVARHDGKSCMNLCQGCWSTGGLFGSFASSVLLSHGTSARLDLTLCAAFLVSLFLVSSRGLVADPPESAPAAGSKFAWPDSYLMKLAIIAFFGLFAEGAVGDWAAVYLHSNVGASLSWAAAGFSAYAIAMAAARFAGGWISGHISETKLLVASGLLTSAGFLTLLLAKAWPIGFIGLAFTGVGVANVVPVIMNASGRSTKTATGTAISTVSTVGYFGFLAGPPLIGWLAHGTSLQLSLGLVVCAGLVVAAGPQFAKLAEQK